MGVWGCNEAESRELEIKNATPKYVTQKVAVEFDIIGGEWLGKKLSNSETNEK